jgi:excisionase family DNA binding protein
MTSKNNRGRNDTSGAAAPSENLLDLKVVAERLGVSVKTVRRKIQRGELAHHRVGRLIRVSERDYADYVNRARNDN